MEPEKQIKDVTAFLMIFVALFFDAFQAVIGWIPAVGNMLAALISLFAFMTFFFWFYLNGIRMITPKRLFSMIGAGVIEMIPYIDLLPAWTAVVIFLIGTTKVKEFASKHSTIASTVLTVGSKIKNMNKTDTLPHVPLVDDPKPVRRGEVMDKVSERNWDKNKAT